MTLRTKSFLLCFSYVVYYIIYYSENKRYNILFIEKPKNLINGKILIFPLNNITYYFRKILEIHSLITF